MKKLLPLFFLLFCLDTSFSQKLSPRRLKQHRARVYASRNKGTVILSLDTIFNKGIPYAILLEKKQLPYNEYALLSLNKETLIYIRSGVGVRDRTLYYAFNFVQSKKTGEPEKYYGFSIEKEIVKYDLVRDGKINPYGEMDFLRKFPKQYSDPYYVKYIEENTVSPTHIYEPIMRDRTKEVFLRDGKILQDFRVVGTTNSRRRSCDCIYRTRSW